MLLLSLRKSSLSVGAILLQLQVVHVSKRCEGRFLTGSQKGQGWGLLEAVDGGLITAGQRHFERRCQSLVALEMLLERLHTVENKWLIAATTNHGESLDLDATMLLPAPTTTQLRLLLMLLLLLILVQMLMLPMLLLLLP